MNANFVTPPTSLQRIDMLLAEIRADKARRLELANPHRANPMVAAVCGDELPTLRAQLAEARRMNGTLAGEVVVLREEKVQLAAAAGAALDWATARGCFKVSGDGPLGETFPIFAEVVVPALNDALAGKLDLAKFAADLQAMAADAQPEGGA